jgi:hypothetical protein
MRYKIKNKGKLLLDQLKLGDIFSSEDKSMLFIYINEFIDEEFHKYNCIDIKSGKPYLYSSKVDIQLYKASITVTHSLEQDIKVRVEDIAPGRIIMHNKDYYLTTSLVLCGRNLIVNLRNGRLDDDVLTANLVRDVTNSACLNAEVI